MEAAKVSIQMAQDELYAGKRGKVFSVAIRSALVRRCRLTQG